MEILTNTNRERLVSIAENYVVDILENKGNHIDDLASAFANAGFTKSEFFQILDKYYLSDYTWTEETTPAKKVNTEDINVGDSDQAILETALTQIGIPYTWEGSRNGNGGWIDLKITDNGELTGNTAAEIYFTKDGKFDGLY
jgi:hypothetical protein